MATRMILSLVVALGLVVAAWGMAGDQQSATPVSEKLLQAQLDFARRTFEEMWKDQQFQLAERPYQWSCRWLEAEKQLSDKKKDQKAACEAHLARMRDLKRATDKLFQQKLLGIEQVYATDYY